MDFISLISNRGYYNKYLKPKTEEELVKLFKEIAKSFFNYDCNVPVHVNPQLTSSLGRIMGTKVNGNYKCLGFDFNKRLLQDDYPLDKIINTMKHELVHWYTDTKNNKFCKHNEQFIENCKKFGVTDFTDFERYKPLKKLGKYEYYEAKCCGCDRVVAKCKNLSNLKRFMNRRGGTVCSCGESKRYLMDKGIKRIYNHCHPYTKVQFWLEIDYFIKDLKIILCK